MGKEKVVYFLPALYSSKSGFWKFHGAGTYVITLHHDNIQVTIFVTCLNFANTGSRILLPSLSSSRGVIPSWKFTLNLNKEVNYRELARGPCKNLSATFFMPISQSLIVKPSTVTTGTASLSLVPHNYTISLHNADNHWVPLSTNHLISHDLHRYSNPCLNLTIYYTNWSYCYNSLWSAPTKPGQWPFCSPKVL